MRPFGKTIALEEARAIIERAIVPIDRTEVLPLHDANGRVLAQDVVSTIDVPPFSRAGMDGYAVRAEDTAGASRTTPRTLRRIETIYTGQMPKNQVGPGECAEIATGAPMPEGADIQKGQHVLQPGTLLNASRLGSIAALGLTEVAVYEKPRVAILSTGNEIVDPGQPLAPGQIYDINRVTVSGVVSDNGGIPVPYRTASDTIDYLSRAVDECLEQDVMVFSGGSSVGERDLILDVVASRGEMLFHGIAVKPGKPTAFGRIGGKLVFGMPGYPTSCLSNAYILLAPALRRIARLPAQPLRAVTLPLASRITSVIDRHQFYSVRIENGQAVPAFKASGDITSMSQADGYIEVPIGVSVVEKGELVDVTLF